MSFTSLRSLPALGLLLLLAPAAGAQINGSIYTTDAKGVVENVFTNAKAVYLAGGPGPNAGCSGNGLPDGSYYFQITDPSGSALLTPESIDNRRISVSGGVFSAAPGGRSTRNGPCGSKIVQLTPFEPSPNSGDEYKVWLIAVADYVPGGPNHGFSSSRSKTDSFKLRGGKPVEQALIEGTVFYDIDGDGIFDPSVPDEAPIPGWRVEIECDGVVDFTFTDSDGHYEFQRDAGALCVLDSKAPDPGYVGIVGGRWLPTTDTVVPVQASVPSTRVDFGVLYLVFTAELSLSKGFWHNQGESLLAACDPEWRTVINGLSLRDNFTVPYPPPTPDPTLFKVSETADFQTAFNQLSNYLVGDPAYGILANILSVQYAAANLNKACGPLEGVIDLHRPPRRLGADLLRGHGRPDPRCSSAIRAPATPAPTGTRSGAPRCRAACWSGPA